MAGNFLSWLVLEVIIGTEKLRYKYVGLFSNNMAAVLWIQREAEKKSAAAGRLLRVLALRKQVARASPLVAAYVEGDLNVLGKIPSRSFGFSIQWNYTNDSEFLLRMNYKFPLPQSVFLLRLLPFLRVEYKSDFRVGEKEISNGRVEETSENR